MQNANLRMQNEWKAAQRAKSRINFWGQLGAAWNEQGISKGQIPREAVYILVERGKSREYGFGNFFCYPTICDITGFFRWILVGSSRVYILGLGQFYH